MELPQKLIDALSEFEAQELLKAVNTCLDECTDNNAKVYLLALGSACEQYGLRGVETQLMYTLSNLAYWRGEKAHKSKQIFKKIERKLAKLNGG